MSNKPLQEPNLDKTERINAVVSKLRLLQEEIAQYNYQKINLPDNLAYLSYIEEDLPNFIREFWNITTDLIGALITFLTEDINLVDEDTLAYFESTKIYSSFMDFYNYRTIKDARYAKEQLNIGDLQHNSELVRKAAEIASRYVNKEELIDRLQIAASHLQSATAIIKEAGLNTSKPEREAEYLELLAKFKEKLAAMGILDDAQIDNAIKTYIDFIAGLQNIIYSATMFKVDDLFANIYVVVGHYFADFYIARFYEADAAARGADSEPDQDEA